MNDWIWLLALVFMGYFGFVLGVQFAWHRNRMHPFIWGLTHPGGRLTPAERLRETPPPWERPPTP